ncbi:hypothetical protein J2S74_002904 [Evansella vedderi]|uniref:VWFA domain-containing protein n=1 Tax=Evansella vedderi TaxID=38282 RepID=A0ABT9ZXR1_9BACI|nr:hypothetical protein [Evansella vedderi]MDQ0255522.1 hypothetical protein [Evansella vedderi]
MTVPAVKDKQLLIKEREGERLNRYLKILFGKEKFGFKWSNKETSYTDGKDVYILYELQRPDCRPFTVPELRALRKGHAVHERGHIEYDIIDHYVEWQIDWSSKDKNDWLDNDKYPVQWLQFFGNTMMDGRLENFIALDHPTTKDYLDFNNYDWRFGIRGQYADENQIHDFRECFMSRALGMTDIEDWSPNAVELVDSVQDFIEQGRNDESTKSVLETTLTIIRKVWPTLLEWMDLQGEEPDDFEYENEHQDSQWGEKEEVEENIKRVMRILGRATESDDESDGKAGSSEEDDSPEENSSGSGSSSSEDDNDKEQEDSDTSSSNDESGEDEEDEQPSKPDFSTMLRQEEKQQEKDEQEAEEETAPYQKREEEVEIDEIGPLKAFSDKVSVEPYPRYSLERYNRIKSEVKRKINATSSALSQLLDPTPDEKRRNQRSGRLKASRVWRTDKLGDPSVFDRRKKGTPAKNARALVLNDISGSTSNQFNSSSSRIIDEMRKAQILMVEACEKANLPVASYGFTEEFSCSSGTTANKIYPFKPYGRFTNTEKGFIGGIEPEMGNRDTVSLQWAVNELSNHDEDIRLLIMISDGLPCFSGGENRDTMRHIVQQAEKQGIDVLCLYVGPQDQRIIDEVQYMYPGRSIIVSNHLSRELSRHVKRVIRQRR